MFLFDGKGGQNLDIVLTNSTFVGRCPVVMLSVLKPDGTVLSSNTACGATNLALSLLTLPVTGTYAVVIAPQNGATGGGGTLSLIANQAIPLTIGNSVNFNISAAGHSASYSFNGTTGQQVNVALTNSTFSGGCFSAAITVLKPDGTPLTSVSACGGDNIDIPLLTLTATGTYTIGVAPLNGGTGGGTLTLSTDQHGTITIGNSVNLNITLPGQNAQYTFSGTAGQAINVAVTSGTFTGGCYQTALSVMKPDGTQLTSGNGCYSGNVDMPFITLPTTGTYTIIVAPQNGSIGSGLLTLSTDQHGIVTLGNPVTVSITTPGQNAQYTFSGAAAQVVNVAITNGTFTGGCYQNQLIILKPDGTQLTSAYGCSSGNVALNSVTLPVSGTYTIIVAPQNGGTGGGTLLAIVSAAPAISSVSPNPASTGSAITVSGSGFGQSQGSSTLTLSGNALTASSWSNTSISAVLPSGAATGSIVVTVGGVASSPVSLTVTALTATTTSLSASNVSPAPGSNITLTATVASSSATGTVTFTDGATSLGMGTLSSGIATYAVSSIATGSHNYTATYGGSSTYAGSTSSAVVVTTNSSAPTVGSLSPSSGVPGVLVTISGVNFGASQGTSTMTLNGAALTPITWSGNKITATIPASAQTGNLIVTVSGVASNGATFTVVSPTTGYMRPLTIAHTMVPNTDQVNFPVLISGVYPFLATVANGGKVQSGSGYDIFFTSDAAGQNLLNHEIDNYNPATGAAGFWVRVPTLSHTADTVIYMWYDFPAITQSQESVPGVWSNGYSGVWHMGNSSGLSTTDSTSNANNATNHGVVSAAGIVGSSGSFDGTGNTYFRVPSSASFKPTTAITLEAWVNMAGTTSYPDFFSLDYRADGTWTSPFQAYALNLNGLEPRLDLALSGAQVYYNSASNLILNQWAHVVGTYDGTKMVVYANGVPVVSQAKTGAISYGTSQDLDLGTRSPYTSAEAVNGKIDEARISTTARTADWIATEYNNLSSPSTFFSLGAEQPGTSLTATTTSLSSSNVSPAAGSNVTLTATVASSSATGTVTFKDGATTLGTGTLSSGVATYIVSAIVTGSHTYTAIYGGNSTYATSTSSAVVVSALTATTTALTSSSVSPAPGSNITLTATVASSSATGTVTFKDGATTLGNGTLSSGVATYTVTAIAAGSHSYTAIYSGSSTYATSSSSAVVVSALPATTTALTSSSASPAPGSNITLTATVVSSSAAGTVTFKDGATTLGAC